MKLQISVLSALPAGTVAFARSPRARKIAWWIFGVLIAIGVMGALIAPPLVRSQLEKELTKALHRKVSIESLRINPYALTVTVGGLRVNERDADTPALSVAELHADVSSASIYRRAPVLASLRISKLNVQAVRLEGNRYNWSDLIDEILAKPSDPNEPPPPFAIANIELLDSALHFDDRPENTKHALTDINIVVPFISSLAVHHDVRVEPKFNAKVDGTPLELLVKTKPFTESRDTALSLDVRGLDLTRFLDYAPGTLPVKIASARFDADLEITFAQPKGRTPTMVLAGSMALLDLDVQEPSGAPLLKLPKLAIEMRAVEPLARRAEIARVSIEAPEARVHRDRSGGIFLARLFTPRAAAEKPASASTSSAPALFYKVDEIALTSGKLDVLDESGSRPVRVQFDEVRLTLQGISGEPGASAAFDGYLHTTGKEMLAVTGKAGLQPLQAEGTIKLEHAGVAALWPYAEPYLALDAVDGRLDFATAFSYQAAGKTPGVMFKEMDATLRSLALRQRWDKQELLRIGELSVRGAALDLQERSLTIGELASTGGRLAVRRDRAGGMNLQKLVPADNAATSASAVTVAVAAAPAATNTPARPWTTTLRKVSIDRYAVNIEDEGAGPAANANIENLALTASNLSTAKLPGGTVALKLTLNKTGTLALNGPLTINPLAGRLKIDASGLGIVPAQPYFERYVNAIVSSGNISASGEAAFEAPDNGMPRGTFRGDVTLADFAAVTKSGHEDLLRWKSFRLGGLDAVSEPLKVAIGEIALADFYTRLVLGADGRFNLQELMTDKDGTPVSAAARPDTTAPAATTAKPQPAPAAPPATASGPAPDIQVGKISLSGGNVQFSDFFIKPNYSANLTGLSGSVSALTRDTAGDVELRARIDNTAPVEISGKINPLAKDLFLDIRADASDIELASLTAYSVKYVGYGIEKGKLSMKVAYKLDNRKLSATNKVILNQLTFGAKVDSPTATKLPVLFAVALLKDRNGVIDIDLPISGSIDDPQFSVGGIIGRVILNLIVKVVTSPFALIGAIFGGSGGEELAYIEFAPGSSELTAAASAKLGNLSKALTDRPALTLEVAGRVDPQADLEGLKKASLERKVRGQKLKDTVQGGAAAGSLDQITVDPAEYPKYLARAYGEEKFPKPRNVIGLAKELPVAEMEQLMLTHTQVGEEDLRRLAGARAQKVKDALAQAKIPAERVFLLAPRLNAEGIKDKGRPTRVDFSLK